MVAARKPSGTYARPAWFTSIVSELGGARLSQRQAADLTFVWCEYEAAIGYKSSFSEPSFDDSGVQESDPYDDATLRAMSRARRVYRVLVRCSEETVRVLHRQYGPMNRNRPWVDIGDTSGLAEWTPQAQRLAEQRGTTPLEALHQRLREPHEASFRADLKLAAEKMLRRASEEYRRVEGKP